MSSINDQNPLRILVGVHAGGLNGIDAYAEQVAAAGVLTGSEVTLVVSTSTAAEALRTRLDARVRVIDLGLPAPTFWAKFSCRLWHGLAMKRLERGVVERLRALGERFQVAHLNHPALADSFRPWAKSVLVAGWFYPHDIFQRIGATWDHTRGAPLRRTIIAAKSVSYFLSDAHGYRAADAVVVPTELLADQLKRQGIRAMVFPPPVQVAEVCEASQQPQETTVGKRLVACAGDLSHPRKNLMDAIDALKLLSPSVLPVHLEMIGRNKEKLCARATKLPEGVFITFPGPLKPFEVQQRMRQADALILPSLYEEWGYVATESLLLGTPVITYPVYPFREMLGDDLGFVAGDCQPESLAKAIERALSEKRRAGIAQIAASRFGAKAVGEKLMRIWGDLANI